MERVIFSELEKQKEHINGVLKKEFGNKLSDEDIGKVSGFLGQFVMHLIEMLKGRKTAHEKFFSDIILNSVDAIIGYDSSNKIFIWNKGAENIYGYSKQEIQGKDIGILIPTEILNEGELEKLDKELKEKGAITNYETIRVTKAGEYKDVSISRFMVKNEEYEVIGNVTIERDITTEKKLEKELREKEKLALIGTVVSSIAHNLSNPLNIISGNADYLLLDRKEGDEGFEELQVIIQETTRITKAIRQILNFSRPVILTKEQVDINLLIREALNQSNFLIKENKEICFRTEFADDLPIVSVDREQLYDVILNFLTNSIQAIKQKGEIFIKTDLAEKLFSGFNEKYFRITLKDNGTGISEKDLPHIFVPFFSTKEYGKGTGLGLAFADRVIKEHNGFIEVTSKQGKGTEFSIYLPV